MIANVCFLSATALFPMLFGVALPIAPCVGVGVGFVVASCKGKRDYHNHQKLFHFYSSSASMIKVKQFL
jgi:hypothetical protein